MSAAFDAALGRQLAGLALPPALADAIEGQRQRLAAIVVPSAADPATAAAITRAVGEAFVAGFRRVMLGCAGLALLGALSAWLLIDARPRPPAAP